ncbi:MAG: primosomal protein N' [Desulfofustis sp.]|nr:primosomal protein N' [Desulfofustis sp.]
MMLLEVAVTAPVRQTYTYSADEDNLLDSELDYVGKRVLVPFGRRPLIGYALGKSRLGESEFQIKPILKIMDEAPYFQAEQISFFRWVADYYHYPLGLVIKTALPSGLTARTSKTISLTEKGSKLTVEDLPQNIAAKSWVVKLFSKGSLGSSESSLVISAKEERADLDNLITRGIASQRNTVEKDRVKAKSELCFGLTEELKSSAEGVADPIEEFEKKCSPYGDRKLSRGEKKILKILLELQQDRSGEMVPRKELRERYPYGERLLNQLACDGVVKKYNRRVYRSPFGELLPHYPKPDVLSAEQKNVVSVVCQSIRSQCYEPFLLHGVTGSGKTEVYLQAAEEAVASNRNVLVLVPEIALATQIEAHFISRFKGKVALLHSGLSAGERFDEWWRILNGEAAIVIGARSAVFAPLKNIGLIVVDEEHDSSYKQDDGLRYNGRDLALVRAKSTGCTVILGSATPSIVSHYHGRTSKYQLLSMTRRIGERKLPEPCIVDLKTTSGKKGSGLFHPVLQKGLQETFDNSNQSILLLNRRGFATSVICRDCGTVVECNHCKVSLNRHRQKNLLLCHYCGYSLTGSVTCQTCGSDNLQPIGFGTERVEEEVRNLIPEAHIARLDSDVAADRKKFLMILKAMREKGIDILVGTQIIAKGLHFPDVSLVGIVMADSGLGFPDYRAAEKTYQLITQVTGRAGRGETKGKVIIQTLQPDHYAISLAADNDYKALIERELAIRQEVGFPPYCRLVFIIVENREDQVARTSSRSIVDLARTWCRTHDHSQSLSVLGPAPAPLERLRDRYRWQILLKSISLQPLHSLVDWISATFQPPSATRVIIDIDPENML